MDPNATWQRLAEAVSAESWEEAVEAAGDLSEWLARGGFPPRITGKETFDRLAARSACDAILAWEV